MTAACSLRKVSHDKLGIEPLFDGENLEICLSGICDSFAVKGLGGYLELVAAEVIRLGLSGVSINVTKLGLLNSSSLKQLITFLRPIKLGERECSVEFVVDEQVPWQRRCLTALVRMCPMSVSVRGQGALAAPGSSTCRLAYALPTPPPPR